MCLAIHDRIFNWSVLTFFSYLIAYSYPSFLLYTKRIYTKTFELDEEKPREIPWYGTREVYELSTHSF